ncbi:MAG: Alpha-L-glutamate ligase-like protein [uncultured bacterium]|nr:MAG: Alpha-L-glutamate ligase-like protein [uncultured bacterium]
MFQFFKNSKKLLGMNSRNLEFIRPYNLRRAKRLADDKLLSKRILKKNEIAVPKLIAKIKTIEDLENFDWQSLPTSFALKPSRGFGGEGIVVVYGKKKNRNDAWIKADRSIITIDDLRSHVRNILDGSFSLSNTPDVAFFEERLQLLKLFKPYCYKGIPDIRIIVFNKVPIMAMLRLPTKESHGKANLQQGAVGVGIDMATGVTTTAIQGKSSFIEKIPDTELSVSGLKIPRWKDILTLAVKTQGISRLGFLGVDVAIDKNLGPVILELNARPGLSIQVANLAGLAERLKRVSGLKIQTIAKGVRMGMDLFGGEIEEEIEEISGKKIIGTVEKVRLTGKNEKEIEVEAKIDTGAYSTSIDEDLAKKLGFHETVYQFSKIDLSDYNIVPENESSIKKDFIDKYKASVPDIEDIAVVFSSSGSSLRPVIKLKFEMDNEIVLSKINIAKRENLKYPMIIGRSDLKKFLIIVQ